MERKELEERLMSIIDDSEHETYYWDGADETISYEIDRYLLCDKLVEFIENHYEKRQPK